MSKIKYKPELDGLRAFAVLSVLIYHLEKVLIKSQTISGGFLGVDIFFVISGYLISLIIFRDLLVIKKFSLLAFYNKRIRRIIPALLFVILFSIIFSIIFFLPNDLVDNTKAALSSTFFISNFYFYFSNVVYGADLSLTKPLLHTWSLSVEEQFYIFFPILFLLINKNFKSFIYFILILIFLSFLSSEYLNSNHRSINFYMTFSRMWELLAGSLIAYIHLFPDKLKSLKKNLFVNTIKTTIYFIGLFFLFLSIFYFQDELNHPSHRTLLVVIGHV